VEGLLDSLKSLPDPRDAVRGLMDSAGELEGPSLPEPVRQALEAVRDAAPAAIEALKSLASNVGSAVDSVREAPDKEAATQAVTDALAGLSDQVGAGWKRNGTRRGGNPRAPVAKRPFGGVSTKVAVCR
jgi:hypothetical protein